MVQTPTPLQEAVDLMGRANAVALDALEEDPGSEQTIAASPALLAIRKQLDELTKLVGHQAAAS